MDLKAHQLEKHPHGLSKDARRDARRVDMRGFENYREPHQPERGGRRRGEGRARGRGRDPNTDSPLPVSSAQNLSRAEMAYQRQLAVQSAQSLTPRTFGGQLTSNDTYAARPRGQQPSTVTAPVGHGPNGSRDISGGNANIPSMDALHINNDNPAQLSQADRARQVRHAAVIERASNLLGNDQAKLSSFRSTISAYQKSTTTAAQLLDTFFTLFDTNPTSLGTLVRELADIFENQAKKDDLLKAWNDWRAINEDYPTLPGPNGIAPGQSSDSTGSGGKRILKLKSSTAQSSQSSVSRARSWGAGNALSGGRSNPFPGLPSANVRTTQGKAPWGASSTASPARAAPTPSAPSRPIRAAAAPVAADAFPSLPAAQKPGMNVMRPGSLGGPRLREGRSGTGTPVNAWTNGGMSTANINAAIEAATADGAEDGKGKGKGKNKKINLMHWG